MNQTYFECYEFDINVASILIATPVLINQHHSECDESEYIVKI